ncbi:MAG: DUF167 domain-containing protein [Candidatus Heimdallarchaeota archaeon]
MRYVVRVKFGKNFVNVSGNEITVGVLSKPEKGKANLEIVKKIAELFNIPSSKVKIVSGFKSRKKFVEVQF